MACGLRTPWRKRCSVLLKQNERFCGRHQTARDIAHHKGVGETSGLQGGQGGLGGGQRSVVPLQIAVPSRCRAVLHLSYGEEGVHGVGGHAFFQGAKLDAEPNLVGIKLRLFGLLISCRCRGVLLAMGREEGPG